MTGWLRRLRARIRYRHFDRDLVEELETHRAMKERELVSTGLAPDEARRQARRDLGNVMLAGEDARAVWIAPWLESIGQDVRHAVRSFRRDRAFTITTVLTLAIGIGATTSTYSIVDGTLFKPLPYDNPERVVMLMSRNSQTGNLAESLGGSEAATLHRFGSLFRSGSSTFSCPSCPPRCASSGISPLMPGC